MSSQSALTLRYAAPKDLREDDGVVVMSDTDRARHEADERLDTILGQLVPSGASVVGGAVGDDTPMTAVQDHVRAFAPDQILLAHRSRNMPTGRKEGSSSGSRARPDSRSGFSRSIRRGTLDHPEAGLLRRQLPYEAVPPLVCERADAPLIPHMGSSAVVVWALSPMAGSGPLGDDGAHGYIQSS